MSFHKKVCERLRAGKSAASVAYGNIVRESTIVDARATVDAGTTVDASVTVDAGTILDAGVTVDESTIVGESIGEKICIGNISFTIFPNYTEYPESLTGKISRIVTKRTVMGREFLVKESGIRD